ncbi:MAG TPA: electron transfer flavoprotein subunit alpha/FixB family protein [Nitrososphaeraceae archaeon]|nr:electron transfer flavoprotein subunit alpha/FixB family protein [Nitrososphaeraceae archaeon]
MNEDVSAHNSKSNSGDLVKIEPYQHLYVVIEHEEGIPVPVSLEMLGEARRLMDNFNKKYSSNEKVVAVVLGDSVRHLCENLIKFGADIVVYADNPSFKYYTNLLYTKTICQIAEDKNVARSISPTNSENFKKPRYMFFSADNTGRHLSSTVMAQLESGLASDINKLVVSDLEIRHEHKTKGQLTKYEKTLEMYRPDFSGFLWTTILCLDNKNSDIAREYHPQSCSIIPGVFEPLPKEDQRIGSIVDFQPQISDEDLRVKILSRNVIKSAIDFESCKIIVSYGRGIRDSPEENFKLVEQFAKTLNAEIGISLPISKRPYQTKDQHMLAYMIPERVIGTSGRKVSPVVYIAIGISGAVQHLAGMKESGFVIAINPDSEAPFRDECDLFIKGRMENILPILTDLIKKHMPMIEKRT